MRKVTCAIVHFGASMLLLFSPFSSTTCPYRSLSIFLLYCVRERSINTIQLVGYSPRPFCIQQNGLRSSISQMAPPILNENERKSWNEANSLKYAMQSGIRHTFGYVKSSSFIGSMTSQMSDRRICRSSIRTFGDVINVSVKINQLKYDVKSVCLFA